MELIVATDSQNGIGYKGKLPWYSKEDLNYFRANTLDKSIIVGRKTAQYLPYLDRRNILCLSRGTLNTQSWKNDVKLINSFSDPYLEDLEMKETIVIAGGAEVYRSALESGRVKIVYRTIVKGEFDTDTYFDPIWLHGFIITKEEISSLTGNIYQVLELALNSEYQYLQLLDDVLLTGNERKGRNGTTLSLFMNTLKFDLRGGFPLLTTKRMFMRGILEEFLFFLRGDTDSTILSKAHVRIWEGNTSKEFLASQSLSYAPGVMGPMYGYQWRYFNAPYLLDKEGRPLSPKGGIDQLANVVNLIKTDPYSRRILMTSYNPSQASEGVLYPCHSITIQFYVQDKYLDMSCYNRSQDLFLGVPYNIASSSLLLLVISKLTGKTPRYISIIMGDTHLYDCHIDKAKLQAGRIPYLPPSLKIPNIENLSDIAQLRASDFYLQNYRSHKSIKALMVV